MRTRARFSTILAVALAAALSGFLPAALAAGDLALAGRVVAAASGAPLEGARVHVADPTTGTIRSSGATAADGSFVVSGLEKRTYTLSVESNGGLYVVDAPLSMKGDRNPSIQLAVTPETAPQPDASVGTGKGAPAKKSVWENPLTATLIVVGAAIVVGAIIGSTTNASTPASPSQP